MTYCFPIVYLFVYSFTIPKNQCLVKMCKIGFALKFEIGNGYEGYDIEIGNGNDKCKYQIEIGRKKRKRYAVYGDVKNLYNLLN